MAASMTTSFLISPSGIGPPGGVSELRAAEADVLRWLPFEARVSRVWLMTGNAAPGSWQTVAELALATG
jgi:hypothetical protein